jgi:hypothetical protein
VVVVPSSRRTPHTVIVGNERRQRWKIERGDPLDEEVSRAPLSPQADYAHLHLVACPVVLDQDFLDRAAEGHDTRRFHSELRDSAGAPGVFSSRYSPDLAPGDPTFERGADGWVLSMGTNDLGQFYRSDDALELRIDQDGTGHLFCGRAAERYGDTLRIFEVIITGLTTRFFAVLGTLYAAGGYLGPVDVGLAVTGLRGGVSEAMTNRVGVSLTAKSITIDPSGHSG